METSESDPSAPSHNNASNGRPPEERAGGAESSPALVPPYWSHRRYESYSSVRNTKPAPITLEDHTEEPSEQSAAVWARGVTLDDYVLVSGTVPSVGSFGVWSCRIETLDVSLDLIAPLLYLLRGSRILSPATVIDGRFPEPG